MAPETSNRDAAPSLLAHPVVHGYLRVCLYILGGGMIGFATFIGFVSIRVNAGFPPLPEPWYPLVMFAMLVGVIAAAMVWTLHAMARRRRRVG